MGSIPASRSHTWNPPLVPVALLAALLVAPTPSLGPVCDPLTATCAERTPSQRERVAALLARRYVWFDIEDVDRLSEVIVGEAEAAGLEPELVTAVIDVESSGKRFAVSRVGAMGLMQLLPNTAKSVAPRAGVDWQGPETLFDPVSNIRLGVSYLDELIDRFGDLEVALTAYNWGPTRIARRLREGEDLPARYSDRVFRVYATLI